MAKDDQDCVNMDAKTTFFSSFLDSFSCALFIYWEHVVGTRAQCSNCMYSSIKDIAIIGFTPN